MLANVLKSAVALLLFSVSTVRADGPPSDFQGYKQWMSTATDEEKYEHFHSLSANFIEKNGEDANKLRICQSLEQDWKGLDNWVD